jgi:hypothetical protein
MGAVTEHRKTAENFLVLCRPVTVLALHPDNREPISKDICSKVSPAVFILGLWSPWWRYRRRPQDSMVSQLRKHSPEVKLLLL